MEELHIHGLQDRIDASAKMQDDAATESKHTYRLSEIWEMRDDVQEYLIPYFLPKNAVASLIGEDGIGKTQILTQLCLHIVQKQKSFLLQPLNATHHRALICATEDSKLKFIQAFSKQLKSMPESQKPLKAEEMELYFTEASNFDNFAEMTRELEMQFSLHHFDLVAIDALSDVFTLIDGNINDSTHARFIIKKLQYYADHFKTCIVLIHHVPKTKLYEKKKTGRFFVEKEDSQGASAITQKPRTTLALTNNPKSSVDGGVNYENFLHILKANYGAGSFKENALHLNFDTRTLLHTYKGTVNIEEFEENKAQAVNNEVQEPGYKKVEWNDQEHKDLMKEVFAKMNTLSRDIILGRMEQIYGVKRGRLEGTKGLLNHVQKLGIVRKTHDGYKLNISSTPMPPDNSFFDDIPPPPLDYAPF